MIHHKHWNWIIIWWTKSYCCDARVYLTNSDYLVSFCSLVNDAFPLHVWIITKLLISVIFHTVKRIGQNIRNLNSKALRDSKNSRSCRREGNTNLYFAYFSQENDSLFLTLGKYKINCNGLKTHWFACCCCYCIKAVLIVEWYCHSYLL